MDFASVAVPLMAFRPGRARPLDDTSGVDLKPGRSRNLFK